LFLRRDQPGNLIVSGSGGGDIDNRIKVLLDALRVPHNDSEVDADVNVSDEPNPFYCLLEDDGVVTDLNVTTDRLLFPVTDIKSHPQLDVRLLIHVRTVVLDAARIDAHYF